MKLDYSLKTFEDRKVFVNNYLLSHNYVSRNKLEKFADYLLFVDDSSTTINERSAESPIITKNREVTLSRRETSLEDTVDKLPGGEDSLWTVASSSDYPLGVKEPLSIAQISKIPNGKEKLRAIETLEKQFTTAVGFRRFKLKKAIIELWQDIYSTRIAMNAAAGYATTPKIAPTLKGASFIELPEHCWIDSLGNPKSDSDFSLFNPTIVLLLLRHYYNLKSEVRENLHCDMHYFLWELESYGRKALVDHPVLLDLCRLEMLGYTGREISEYMEVYHNISHSEQYFSTLWTKKIPKLISEEAKKHYIQFYWRSHNLPFKTCSKCSKVLPANPYFFHRNTSSDGFYSMCKDCRQHHYVAREKYSQDPFTGRVVETRLLAIGYVPEGGDNYG